MPLYRLYRHVRVPTRVALHTHVRDVDPTSFCDASTRTHVPRHSVSKPAEHGTTVTSPSAHTEQPAYRQVARHGSR